MKQKASVKFVGTEPKHLNRIANNLRYHDVQESTALGHSPKEAVRSCYRNSLWCLTVMIDDVPHGVFGVAPLSMVEGVGSPFFLGTDAIYGHGRTMLTKGMEVLNMMAQTFPVLTNRVSAHNDKAIRLLKRWGFEVSDTPENIGGVSFLDFRMQTNV